MSIDTNSFNDVGKNLYATVYSFEIRETSRQKHTIFKLQVRLSNQTWSIERRYKEFDQLYNEIKKFNPNSSFKFPGKNYFGDNFNLAFIRKRMFGLDEFIKDALTDPHVVEFVGLWDFLDLNENRLREYEKESSDAKQVFNNKQTVGVTKYTRQISRDEDKIENQNQSNENEINLGISNNPVAKPSDFEFLSVIGKGSFGKVFLANHKFENKIYAIKVLNKEAIIKRNEVKHVMAERNVLIRNLSHPFLVGLHYSFQSNDKLYFVLDYVNGGELFFHLSRNRKFKEPRAKFYAAEIAHAIGYMHSKDIIYRDLKPENILIDAEGHVKLTDFGLCKEGIRANSTTDTFCGTPEYLAPEILKKKPYTRAVDWWCLGSVTYEMLFGLPPFYSRDTNEMYNNIVNRPLILNPEVHLSFATKSFLVQLLEKDHTRRLGSSDADFNEVGEHCFFSEISWHDLIEKRIPVPWLPNLESETDLKHIDPEFTGEQVPASIGKSYTTASGTQNSAFSGFTYVPEGHLI